MGQPVMTFAPVGVRRTGSNRGGRRQMYFLDDVGRALILARYDGRTETINWLCARLHVPRWRLKRWACALGLARANPKEPPWTDEEVAYLEGQMHLRSVKAIARHVGRTETAVRLKAKRIGICKGAEGLTMRGLCAGLGCDHHKIERWLREGWLRGTRRQSERVAEQGGDMWLFRERNIRAFVRDHPAEVDPRRVDWPWLVDVLTHMGAD